MKSDIEIAREREVKPIREIALSLGLKEEDFDLYGRNKAKLNIKAEPKSDNLILVTAINPTAQGEGKTTIAIGLADGLRKIGKKSCLALREPSLGPVFGIKGGAAGGGYSQVVPMEEINLHFTGDFHAITTANNLVSSIIDNHLTQGNELRIDPEKITWKRCIDLNDRALRSVSVAEGGGPNGIPRRDGFNITAASQMMAIFCLAKDLKDFKRRVKNSCIGRNIDNQPVTCGDLKIEEAVTILVKEALKPNLVQTLEGTPAIIHGGPFANIAHGCNSVIATKTALTIADYVVTEAGFGADLGAEKFIDIKCRALGMFPKVAVIVASVKALKYNGSGIKENLSIENLEFLEKGIVNLGKHIDNLSKKIGLPVIVALNRFASDTDKEIQFIRDYCEQRGAEFEISEAFSKGGEGSIKLARKVVKLAEKKSDIRYVYNLEDSIKGKIEKIAKEIYGAKDVEYTDEAMIKIDMLKGSGYENYPVCIAKTQYSLTDDSGILGAPEGFTFHVRDIEVRTGAEFIVALAGSMLLMPGLSKTPGAIKMSISDEGIIEGLF
ncbi:MAG: Formate--tetrahydrofolate ligase [Firmicutes bacterium ADurb.Bin080]|mgnify:CR=1 FL=1|jgi:formate--tetrahydrofolate ligase|nr:formate--tetrahydrofolate ligase [Clostridiales bacterium]OQC16301.1 MAG: Formate--tetrahydrofolate ligase [Firmicutes bacterium ADurb.Bin080]